MSRCRTKNAGRYLTWNLRERRLLSRLQTQERRRRLDLSSSFFFSHLEVPRTRARSHSPSLPRRNGRLSHLIRIFEIGGAANMNEREQEARVKAKRTNRYAEVPFRPSLNETKSRRREIK